MSTGKTPAFYALGTSGAWKDYVNLLHIPYTLWHLSYVVLGAALASTVHVDRLIGTVVAEFLDVAHVLLLVDPAQLFLEVTDVVLHFAAHRRAFHPSTGASIHVGRRMDPTTQLIVVELAVAVLIHHAEEDVEYLVNPFCWILRHFDAFRLFNIGRRHDDEHGGRAVVLPHSVRLGEGGGGSAKDEADR